MMTQFIGENMFRQGLDKLVPSTRILIEYDSKIITVV